jgi:L-alanine-DL-glutamate epimerase-like enolase superfamily enzyme
VLDYPLHAALAERYPGPLATGENLFSLTDARNLVRYAGMRADRVGLTDVPGIGFEQKSGRYQVFRACTPKSEVLCRALRLDARDA